MRFVSFEDVARRFRGKVVAIVGSGPSCQENAPGFIDSHELVVRVNNYRTGAGQGLRTDVHYSFYGSSIRKTPEELQADGVRLCVCKCPNSKPIESEWHELNEKRRGIDFTYIYSHRRQFWFCDVFVPDDARFMRSFELLGKHIPTTGFAAILDVLDCEPKSLYLTGFDFFSSGVHNVNERWKPGDPTDPIGHRPELEAAWLRENAGRYPVTFDAKLSAMLAEGVAA